jgi:queuine tRNA-ribosyltransferase accessory subunit
MEQSVAADFSCLPPEMLVFTLKQAVSNELGPRVGQLLRRSGRARGAAIDTPHYVATTSRGVVPHVSHDVLQKSTAVSVVYISLEDCKNFPAQALLVLTITHRT